MCNIWHYVLLTAKAYNRYICQYLCNKDKSLFIRGLQEKKDKMKAENQTNS